MSNFLKYLFLNLSCLISGSLLFAQATEKIYLSGTGPADAKQWYTLGCNSDTTKINVRVIPKTGLSENNTLNELVVYPQPAFEKLFLSGDITNISEAQLLSMEGKILVKFNKNEIDSRELHFAGLNSGVYFLKVVDKKQTERIIKISVVR